MATMKENANIVTSAARQMRAIIELAEQIENISEVQREADEARADLLSVRAAVDASEKALVEAREEVEAAKAEAKKLKEEASKAAKLTKDKADIAAKAKMSAAEEESAKLVADAKIAAASWDQRVVAARDELDVLKREQTEVQAKLDSAKNAVKKLVEGVK